MFAVMDDGALVPQCSSAAASVTLNDWTVDTVDKAENAVYKRGRPMSRTHIMHRQRHNALVLLLH